MYLPAILRMFYYLMLAVEFRSHTDEDQNLSNKRSLARLSTSYSSLLQFALSLESLSVV